MIAEDGSTVLLAATGHIRSFIAQRMNEDSESSTKANLEPITAKIIAYPTGSGFESDWIVHERARLADADLYTKLNDQNRRAMLVLDIQSGTWHVEDTVSLQVGQGEIVIGPILTKKAANSLGEALDDVFELCRYPKELALAPSGTPCAYKQMGRCPGACDGSEPMEAYKERFCNAIKTAAMGVEQLKRQIKDEIAQASSALDFEHAQGAKRQLEQIEKLPMDTLGLAQAMHEMRCVCITPSVRKGWAMIWRFDTDGLVPIQSVSDHDGQVDLQLESWCGLKPDRSVKFDQRWLDRFALIARHWMTKPSKAKRRRVTILDLRDQEWGADFQGILHRAIADACTPVDLDLEDEEHTHIVR